MPGNACAQDKSAASILGEKTYNEVVERLVTIMGSETPKHLLVATSSMRRTTSSITSALQVCSHTSHPEFPWQLILPTTRHLDLQHSDPGTIQTRDPVHACATSQADSSSVWGRNAASIEHVGKLSVCQSGSHIADSHEGQAHPALSRPRVSLLLFLPS